MQGEWIRRPKNGVGVIFVHGILSSGEACWQNRAGSYWPSLLLREAESEQTGIYVFSYKTGIFVGNFRLGNVVDSLKELMGLDGLFDCRVLIFVAHSMGGLVVRKLIVERAVDFIDRDIGIGLFLIASPSLGAGYANLLSPLARLLGNSHADALRFSQDNAWLMDLDKEFMNLKEAGRIRVHGKELVEDRFIILKGLVHRQVVEPFAGARYFGEPVKIPDSDHFTIAKPDSEQAPQHRILVQFIADCQKRLLPARDGGGRASGSQHPLDTDESSAATTLHQMLPLLEMSRDEKVAFIRSLTRKAVPAFMVPELWPVFADATDMNGALDVVQRANGLRCAADPQFDPKAIALLHLPTHGGSVGAYWSTAFTMATARGARMVAALLLAAPPHLQAAHEDLFETSLLALKEAK